MDAEVMQVPGERYEALVPDTLDLAERAGYGINALVGQIAPQFDYECWWLHNVLPPSVYPHSNQWFDQNPRTLWTLPLLRTMCGSGQGLDLEERMREALLARVTEDGLYLNAPFDTPGAWWRKGGAARIKDWPTDEDFTNAHGLSLMLLAATARTHGGEAGMRELGGKLAATLCRIAIRKEDYAYYPATSGFGAEYTYLRHSGWPDTKEAISDQDDPEGAVTCYHAMAIQALARWAAASGDAESLETAGRLVQYVLKPQFWTGGCSPWTEAGGTDEHNAREIRAVHGGAERKPAALFQGHQAGMAYTFTGLIDYALVANDAYLKEWVRQGYEYFRNLGLPRIGMWGENIANNQMAVIAIKLSDAGAGDYWDDVDECVRNAFVEDQYVDLGLLRHEAGKHGVPARQATEYGEFDIERMLGCLRHEGLIDDKATLDPTNNGAKRWWDGQLLYGSCYLEPFYYAWESTTRFADGVAQVNLLLNRASPWLDIDSHIPFEGKVVLHNKRCEGIHVRIPKWVDRRALACEVDGRAARFSWAGSYLILSGLAGTETVALRFPMVESVEAYHLLTADVAPKWWERTDELPTYVLHMRGSTCLKAEFTNRERFTSLEPVYPVFQREHFRRDRAPMRSVIRYVAPAAVPV